MTKKINKNKAKVTKTKAKAKFAPAKKVQKTQAKVKAKVVKTVVKAKAKPQVKKAVKAVVKTAKKTVVAKAPVKVAPKIASSKAAVAKAATAKTPVKAVSAKTVKAQPVTKPLPAAAKPQVIQMTQRPAAPMASMASRMNVPQRPQQQGMMQRPMMQRPGGPLAARPAAAIRPANDTPVDFRAGDYVVYPAHGVGTIEGVETQSIAGMSVTLYAISFEKDRMRLKIPVQKAQIAGLRKLSSGDRLKDALKTLTGKAKIKRTMWSRRAQEYEAKINSGDPVQIAEVLRDLRRPKDDTEQSYSERQIYQSALERLAREVAAVQRIAEAKAVEHLETVLAQAA